MEWSLLQNVNSIRYGNGVITSIDTQLSKVTPNFKIITLNVTFESGKRKQYDNLGHFKYGRLEPDECCERDLFLRN
jgi:hypothetical protein